MASPDRPREPNVICPRCGASNEDGRKFCGECAGRLVATCPACGTANTPTARFCGECAAPLRDAAMAADARDIRLPAPADAPAAERKLVSVLFADLVGFTPFAEERDAEEVRETLTRYFDLASEVIGRYGGTVEKFIGDAVMAVWGTPTAHEDDAERAVRAALDLVGAVPVLGTGIQARCAVLTGEAAVTLGATNQGMVAGDLVNTAARLQSVAPPGAVLVGEATHMAAARAIVFEEAGEQVLKGKTAPVTAWRALRVVAERGGRNRSEALEAPFVGRDEELRLLKDLFHATERDRRVRLVSVMGPAGIGKSRLAWEFLKYVDGLVETVWWHDGRSPAYGDGITFWALGEMIRGRCGLLETDDEPTTRAKVAEAVERFVPDASDHAWIEAALLVLLGLEPGAGSEQLFGAWRTFFERLGESAPVVLVFEDLHFADAGLLDFIDHLLDWSRGVPIYVVSLARPELLERRPSWGAAKRNFVSLTLEPLPPSAMQDLLAGLVPGLPQAAIETIVARADGIPLYAVETVRMLVAQGRVRARDGLYVPMDDLSDLSVPETLTALIGSRLDGLPADDRSLLQYAAVLGQSFTPTGLSMVSGLDASEIEPRLRVLVQRELLTLQADPRSPEQGQYAFIQALIREVAYNTLAKRDRKIRHIAAARFFESLGSDELAGALAGHYLAAFENSPAGPEADALAGQARIALKAAADRAVGLGSLKQAVTFLDQARAIAVTEEEQVELLERSGVAASEAGMPDVAERQLREAVARRKAAGDPAAIARATALLGESLISNLRPEAAIALLETAVEELIGTSAPADSDRVALLAQLSRARFMTDDFSGSIALADRALEAAERLDLVPIVADLLVTRGSSLALLGRGYEGTGLIKAGMELADAHELWSTALRARINLGVRQVDTDPRAAFESARAALALARRLGRRSAARTLLGNVASAAIDVGEWDLAIRELRDALDGEADQLGRNYLDWSLLSYRALRGEKVADTGERLLEWAATFDESTARAAVHDLRAEQAFAAGRFAEAADEWMTFGASNALNAPRAYLMAGISGLIVGDVRRSKAALVSHEAQTLHGRLVVLDRRLLGAGIDLLAGGASTGNPVRDLHDVAAAYRDLGLPWRRALTGVVAASVGDVAQPEIRALAHDALEILQGLEARPFADRLESALGQTGARTVAPVASSTAPVQAR